MQLIILLVNFLVASTNQSQLEFTDVNLEKKEYSESNPNTTITQNNTIVAGNSAEISGNKNNKTIRNAQSNIGNVNSNTEGQDDSNPCCDCLSCLKSFFVSKFC